MPLQSFPYERRPLRSPVNDAPGLHDSSLLTPPIYLITQLWKFQNAQYFICCTKGAVQCTGSGI